MCHHMYDIVDCDTKQQINKLIPYYVYDNHEIFIFQVVCLFVGADSGWISSGTVHDKLYLAAFVPISSFI